MNKLKLDTQFCLILVFKCISQLQIDRYNNKDKNSNCVHTSLVNINSNDIFIQDFCLVVIKKTR